MRIQLDWFGDDKKGQLRPMKELINCFPDDLKGTTNETIQMDRTKPGNQARCQLRPSYGWSFRKAHIYGW